MIIFIGASISLSGMFLSSYTKSLGLFILSYPILSGLGCGMMYMVPLQCGWDYFPNKRGLISGIVVGFYAVGSAIYTQLSTYLINPDDEKATV